MKKLLLTIIISISSQTVFAQVSGSVNTSGQVGGGVLQNNGTASTPAEGYLNGIARVGHAIGTYLADLGHYENLHQEALSKSYKNIDNKIHLRWKIQDDYKKRKEIPSFLEKEILYRENLDTIKSVREEGRKSKTCIAIGKLRAESKAEQDSFKFRKTLTKLQESRERLEQIEYNAKNLKNIQVMQQWKRGQVNLKNYNGSY